MADPRFVDRGGKQVLLRDFPGRAVAAFETREQALDWLVRQ